jgi:hypothetical protein
MQIREITQQLNENALGAFGAGFAQGAGISVPDTGTAGGAVVSAYGDARQKAAAQAARPLIAALAKKEMQAWNVAIADMLKKEKVQSREQLSPASKSELARDLNTRLHVELMKNSAGADYTQGLPNNVDQLSQPKATALVDRLNTAKQDILDFDQPATATQQLAQWQALSQAAYEAMSLTQFYPARKITLPEILPNPDGTYNIGKLKLTGNPVDQLIVQKIQAEQQKNPNAKPQLRSNTDGSINIGAQRLDPRNPDEAKAIARIESAMDSSAPAAPGPAAPSPAAPAAPQPAQNKPAAAPVTFNAANIMKTIKPTAVAAESNRKQQLTQNNKK